MSKVEIPIQAKGKSNKLDGDKVVSKTRQECLLEEKSQLLEEIQVLEKEINSLSAKCDQRMMKLANHSEKT